MKTVRLRFKQHGPGTPIIAEAKSQFLHLRIVQPVAHLFHAALDPGIARRLRIVVVAENAGHQSGLSSSVAIPVPEWYSSALNHQAIFPHFLSKACGGLSSNLKGP